MITKKRWSHYEETLLAECLESGCIYSNVQWRLPNRTKKSILRKALYLGYSSSQKGDEIIFTYGIKRRDKSKEETRNVDIPSYHDRKNLFQIITKSEYINNLISSISGFLKRNGDRHAS